MATKIKELVVSVGKYKDRNGQEKTRWENIGAVWQDKDAQGNTYSYIMEKATFNPAGVPRREGSDSVKINLFDTKEKTQGNAQTQEQQQSQQNLENFQDNFSLEAGSSENIEACPF